jgi:hypothetical protein
MSFVTGGPGWITCRYVLFFPTVERKSAPNPFRLPYWQPCQPHL